MELIKYIILGLLQGLTEPLPISSSGHIYIFKTMVNANLFEGLSLEIFLNFASFIAILLIFRKDVWKLIKGFVNFIRTKGKESKEEFKYCMMIVIGTIPVGLLGIVAKDALEDLLSKNVFFVGVGFLITGLALLSVLKGKETKTDKDISWKDAIMVGIYQAISIVPGISRSGMTLVGCLINDQDKKTALKFSFMLYFPVSIASMITELKDISHLSLDINVILYYIAGMIAAGLATYLSYNWLTKLVEKGKLWRFSFYLFAIAIFTIMFFI